MAQEVVVREVLTSEMIEAGAGLIRRIDPDYLFVSACLWLYLPESDVWRLIIASPEVDRYGPRRVYQKIQSVLSEIPEDIPHISLMDISVVEDNDSLVSLLRRAVKTGDSVSGVRFSRNTINGQFIDDAYIYRMT